MKLGDRVAVVEKASALFGHQGKVTGFRNRDVQVAIDGAAARMMFGKAELRRVEGKA
jgi:hypothetical protein